MIARMWESRVNPGQLDDFCEWARAEAWPQFAAAQGFLGGELYRSDEQHSAVIVTRWADADTLAAGNAWFDLGAERFCAAEANAWEFTPVPVGRQAASSVTVRYIVTDVDVAIEFYRDQLGFSQVMHPAPTFAMLSRGPLRLALSAPSGAGGGGQLMPDGTVPEPGGWNRVSLQVADLEATVERLRGAGARFRNDIVTGVGGKQILLNDPFGNPVELFEPLIDEARE